MLMFQLKPNQANDSLFLTLKFPFEYFFNKDNSTKYLIHQFIICNFYQNHGLNIITRIFLFHSIKIMYQSDLYKNRSLTINVSSPEWDGAQSQRFKQGKRIFTSRDLISDCIHFF